MLRTRTRERILLDACLAAKQPLVVDNAEPHRGRARPLHRGGCGGEVRDRWHYFRSTAEESLAVNERRGA